MTSAHILGKAIRLLATGAVHIVHVDHTLVVAHIIGGSANHVIKYQAGDGWSCTCPARNTCSHQRAVELCATRRQAQHANQPQETPQ